MLDIPIKDYFRETRLFSTRLSLVVIAVVALTLALVARLVYLQIISYRHYATLSQANSIQARPIPPVRGQILDRNGVVLAENMPVFTLEIVPEQVDDLEALLTRLGAIVRLTTHDIKNFKKQLRRRPPFESLALRTRLSPEEAARIAVNRPELDGVELHARLQRHYPLGGLGVHAIGYVGRIDEQELSDIDRSTYRGTEHIGKLGVEQRYEKLLLGEVGIERIESNAHGRMLRVIERIAPRAGDNVYLNLDARVQAVAEAAFKGRRGAAVALDPRTGAVLVFASSPVYDPNAFVDGIDPDSYRSLLADANKPLINRALNGQYAPGSTVKPFLALAALALEGFDPSQKIVCNGSFRLPGARRIFRDWRRYGHGEVDLHTAIVESCDIYFYQLAVRLGIDAIKNALARFGFGAPTGVDILGESAGLLPSREWKEARGEPWYPGETVVTGIGQGPLLVTPLQLATAAAALANQGMRMRPRLLGMREDPRTKARAEVSPEQTGKVPIADLAQWQSVLVSMIDVVHGERGTARGSGWNATYRMAGKTGTAQVTSVQGEDYDEQKIPEHLRDHALFIAFAPAHDPQIAVAVVVENGGHGSSAAAPIARKILDAYLGSSAPIRPPAVQAGLAGSGQGFARAAP